MDGVLAYDVLNKGKKLTKYKITAPSGQHCRFETVDGKEAPIFYKHGTPNDVISLTDSDAEKYKDLGLRRVGDNNKVIENLDDDNEVEVDGPSVVIPDDWKDMSLSKKAALAKKIAGKKVDKSEVDAVIEAAAMKVELEDGTDASDSN